MKHSSRIPGFYKLTLAQRLNEISKRTGIALDRLTSLTHDGGLDPEAADKVVENVLGVYGLPFGVALNFTINGRDHLVPMVVEEPSVIAAASNAARMIRAGGGFVAECIGNSMIGQVHLWDVPDAKSAKAAVEAAKGSLMEQAADAVPNLVKRGGGPTDVEALDLGDGVLV